MTRWLFPLLLALIATPALAEPTTITVRALAKDAKFIGTGMGGVKVRLVQADSGAVLAEGVTAGETGDTDRLVVNPRKRGERLSRDGDAQFTAVVDLSRPTLVRLEAEMKPEGGRPIQVSSTAWILPGAPVVADGWVIEIPGLVVAPAIERKGERLTVNAKVVLMCGCPVTPGGLWDADGFKVEATLEDRTGHRWTVPMTYAGKPSTFTAVFERAPRGGPQKIVVTATDTRTGNVGLGDVFELGAP